MSARYAVVLVLIAACDRSTAPAPTPVAKLAPIDPPAARGAMAPNLVAAGDGVLLTWLEPVDDKRTAHRLRFARFSRGSWSSATTITEGPRVLANWADVPSIAQQRDGIIVAHWAEKMAAAPHAYDAVVARSADGGMTWNRLGTVHRDGTATEHGFVSLVPDGASTLALWLDGRAMADGAAGATMLRAASIGETIGTEQVVDDRVCDCCSTAAAMTADGPAVAFRDRSPGEVRDPGIARRTTGRWSPPHAVHADGWNIPGCPVNGPAIAAVGREVAVAWYTLAAQRPTVRIAFSADAGATFERPIEVDAPRGARSPIGRVDVVIDRPGTAIVSWVAAEREAGRLLVRRIARDGRGSAELELTAISASRDGGFPRIESLADDLVFAWTDTLTATVRAARIARIAIPN